MEKGWPEVGQSLPRSCPLLPKTLPMLATCWPDLTKSGTKMTDIVDVGRVWPRFGQKWSNLRKWHQRASGREASRVTPQHHRGLRWPAQNARPRPSCCSTKWQGWPAPHRHPARAGPTRHEVCDFPNRQIVDPGASPKTVRHTLRGGCSAARTKSSASGPGTSWTKG